MGRKNTDRYDADSKEQAAKLALDLGSNTKAAASLGMSPKTLKAWVMKPKRENYRPNPKGKSVGELEAENAGLRKQNREWEQANLILKKSRSFRLSFQALMRHGKRYLNTSKGGKIRIDYILRLIT